MRETINGRVPTAPDWSGSAPSPSVSALTGDHSSRGPTEAERMQATFDRITHRKIMAAARGLSSRRHHRSPNWAFAMGLFGLGSTYAWALCEQMGIDPDATTLTPWPETPPPEAPTSRVGEE